MTAVGQVRVEENPPESRYDVLRDGVLAGFTVYRPLGEAWAFVHTQIEQEHEGLGLGSTLVRFALDDLLGRGIGVLPYCPFVRAFIAEHPDPYLALVPLPSRARFGL